MSISSKTNPASPFAFSLSIIHCWMRALTGTRFMCGGNFGFGFPLYPPRLLASNHPIIVVIESKSLDIKGSLKTVPRFTKKDSCLKVDFKSSGFPVYPSFTCFIYNKNRKFRVAVNTIDPVHRKISEIHLLF